MALLRLVGVFVVCLLLPLSHAVEITHEWPVAPANPSSPLIPGPNGAFYALFGGTSGIGAGGVIRVSETGDVTTLKRFESAAGFYPAGLVFAADGNFYGTGMLEGQTVVFRITSLGETTTLWTGQGWSRAFESGLTQGSDGNFYGVDPAGGLKQNGTIIRITPGGKFSTAFSFTKTAIDGAVPQGALFSDGDGNLYGACERGGSSNGGTIFKISPEGVFTVVHPFNGKSYSSPRLIFKDRDGVFYGTVFSNTSWESRLFRLAPGGSPTILNISWVDTLTQAANGDLYATARAYSYEAGSVFRITPSGVITEIFAFPRTQGGGISWLTPLSNGNLLGVTQSGGSANEGTVFELTAEGGYTLLHTFFSEFGSYPDVPLTAGPGGVLYGVTYLGGRFGAGTIFRLDSAGQITVLHAFDGSDGANPRAALLHASDGALYGTTESGGETNCGTIFRITADGLFTSLHTFERSSGAAPADTLIEGAGGVLYGTTSRGGKSERGTVYRIPLGGELQVLAHFPKGWMAGAYGSFVLGGDGVLYGAAIKGGYRSIPLLYQVSAGGQLKVIRTLTPREGTFISGLTLGEDGAVYGVCSNGGKSGLGTVFRLQSNGKPTVIHTFSGADAALHPSGRLTKGSDGNFYGIAMSRTGAGLIAYKLTPAGDVSQVDTLPMGASGWDPTRQVLTEGSDGLLYGVMSSGFVFRLPKEAPPNRAPVAEADEFLIGDERFGLYPVENDSDPDGDALRITAVTQGSAGTVIVSSDGRALFYERGGSFAGTDTFTYQVSDDRGGVSSATVTVRDWAQVRNTYSLELQDGGGEIVGRLELQISGNGVFTGKVYYKGEVRPVRGEINFSGSGGALVPMKGGYGFLEVNVSSLSETTFVPGLSGRLWLRSAPLTFSGGAVQAAGALAGQYTVMLQLPSAVLDPASLPAGAGWALMSIREDGSIVMKGKLPDGAAFSTSTWMSSGESALVYAASANRFSVAGPITFEDVENESDAAGFLRWSSGPSGTKRFSEGIETEDLSFVASRYVPPAQGSGPLAFTTLPPEADVVLAGGALSVDYPAEVTFTSVGTARVSGIDLKTKLRIDTFGGAEGLWSGSFLHPGNLKQKRSFKGVIFQKQNRAEALFIDRTQTGRVTLEPR